VRLKVKVAADGSFTLHMATLQGAFAALPQTFKATEGAWLGAKVGLFSISSSAPRGGVADFGYFNFSAL
jgi:hypothetical protein